MKDLIDLSKDLSTVVYSDLDDLEKNRLVLELINAYFFQTSEKSISTTSVPDGNPFMKFSDFGNYFEAYHQNLLDIKVNLKQCEKVANQLHRIVKQEGKEKFYSVPFSHGTVKQKEKIGLIRFFFSTQDFGTLGKIRNLEDCVKVYNKKNEVFDPSWILANTRDVLRVLDINSQLDKREIYLKNAASFIIEHGLSDMNFKRVFGSDLTVIRKKIINAKMGYGYKKANMFIRDMLAWGVWTGYENEENIGVASDVHTMKLGLKFGIIAPSMTLLSSFLDIATYQYVEVDKKNQIAWRKVWELWRIRHPETCGSCPASMDYYLYNFGKNKCKRIWKIYECTNCHSVLLSKGGRKNCPECGGALYLVRKGLLPCQVGKSCKFDNICTDSTRNLDPPKAISIRGQTGWDSSRSYFERGGGGLRA